MFDTLHAIGSEPVIKIRKNAALENIRGSKHRRKEAREYKKEGYRVWADNKSYGMRWVGTGVHFQRWKGSLERTQFHGQRKGWLQRDINDFGYMTLWNAMQNQE